MVTTCFYFQVHQPTRLKKYTVFDINHSHDYFDHQKNEAIIKRVAKKCYLPANKLIFDLIRETEGKFRVSYSISGVALQQFEKYVPEVLESFKELAKTGAVEFLSETFYHSLSFLYSKEEFKEQIEMHRAIMQREFKTTPLVFRNTELIYNNELATLIEELGFKGILAEGADHVLGWQSPNFLYRPQGTERIKLLLKNYRLSDDIAFRFSERSWKDFPLTAEKFAQWINAVNGNGQTVNLFMDYETFGEHQWAQTGIFRFLRQLPSEILKHPDNNFMTPSEVIERYESVGMLDVHHPMSWADVERDLSAWRGNMMQNDTLKSIYALEHSIKQTKDEQLINDWRLLQTSDHFYYMCTKWFSDGDVHKYFNPYDSPYDSFIIFNNVVNDLMARANNRKIYNPIEN